ncbi:hypothetical protein CapIbe_000476 [Capra ibex]
MTSDTSVFLAGYFHRITAGFFTAEPLGKHLLTSGQHYRSTVFLLGTQTGQNWSLECSELLQMLHRGNDRPMLQISGYCGWNQCPGCWSPL